MKTENKKKPEVKPEYPKVLETFYHVGDWELSRMKRNEPSSFNGVIDIERYRVTVEKIEEPKEVYEGRLKKLWRECDNHHHWQPLKSTAERYGVELRPDEMGIDVKKKTA